MKQEVFIFLPDDTTEDAIKGGNLFITPPNFAFPAGTQIPSTYVFTTLSGQIEDDTLYGRITMVFHDEPVIIALKYGIPGKMFYKLLDIEKISGSKIASATIERIGNVEQ